MIDRSEATPNRSVLFLGVVIAVLIGFGAALLFFPGIPTADGLLRDALATRLVNGSMAAVERVVVIARFPILLNALSLWVTGTHAAIMFAQAVLFCLGLMICVGAVGPAATWTRLGLGTLICVLPLTLVFGVIQTDSIWTCIGICFVAGARQIRASTWIRFLGLLCAVTLLVGSRPNAPIVLPVLAACIALQRSSPSRLLDMGAVAAGTALAILLPSLLINLPPARPLGMGLGWELVGIAKGSGSPDLAHVLDFVGDTQGAIERFTLERLNPIFWDQHPPIPVRRAVEPVMSSEIARTYVRVAVTHPADFIATKLDFWGRVLGISEPLLIVKATLSYPGFPFEGDAGPLASAVYDLFGEIGDSAWSLARYPWALMLAGIAFCTMRLWQRRTEDIAFIAAALATTYYASFLLVAQAMEFRYFAQTYFVLVAVLLGEIAGLFQRGIRREARGG
jgi:hypothetical protein